MKNILLLSLLTLTTLPALAKAPNVEEKIQDFFAPQFAVQRNLQVLSDMRLSSGAAASGVWTGSYLPIYLGGIGQRYADPAFPNSLDWRVNWSYMQSPAARTTPRDQLSPAEKYDLLVGDADFSMTKTSWAAGQKYLSFGYESVPTWMGLNHGTVAAGISTPQPVRAVTVTSADGKALTFYPDDIKALQSFLWANARLQTNFVGYRCEKASPQAEPYQYLNKQCDDLNPATFHLTLLNRMGLQKKSFLADLSQGTEVWSHPIVAFKTTFLHPVTQERTDDLSQARLAYNLYSNDLFRKYRNPSTQYVVDVETEITYVKDSQFSTESPKEAPRKVRLYRYDLEMDANFNAIGGEWHTWDRADFAWQPKDGSVAISRVEWEAGLKTMDWDGKAPLPQAWRETASKISRSNEILPLKAVVDRLTELSRQ